MRRGSLYLEGTGMERLHRLLRLARLRGDLVAIATIETAMMGQARIAMNDRRIVNMLVERWTESELRMAWGDR